MIGATGTLRLCAGESLGFFLGDFDTQERLVLIEKEARFVMGEGLRHGTLEGSEAGTGSAVRTYKRRRNQGAQDLANIEA